MNRQAPSDGPITVATFNIRNGRAADGANHWLRRRRAVVNTLRSLDADVIGLQEAYAFQIRYIERRLTHFAVAGEGRDGGARGEHCPIFIAPSRAAVVAHRTRWFGSEPDRSGTRLPGARFARIATIVELLDTATHEPFTVVTTHLDEAREDSRVASTRQLAGWLEGRAAIVLADLNAEPGTRALTGAVFEPLRVAGLRPAVPATPGGTFHGFRGDGTGPRIDHILVSEHFAVLQCDIVRSAPGARLASDHWPVRAVIARKPD